MSITKSIGYFIVESVDDEEINLIQVSSGLNVCVDRKAGDDMPYNPKDLVYAEICARVTPLSGLPKEVRTIVQQKMEELGVNLLDENGNIITAWNYTTIRKITEAEKRELEKQWVNK